MVCIQSGGLLTMAGRNDFSLFKVIDVRKFAFVGILLSPFMLHADWDEELEEEDQSVYVEEIDQEDDFDDEFFAEGHDATQNVQKQECTSPFHTMRIGVRHTEARGVGYDDGYTTLEGFGIYNRNPCFMPFLDLRGHVFNNGKLSGNIGIGERSVISSIDHIFGAYFYYDVRQEDHHLSVVNQLSPGVELLGKRMEYRINGYFPVGKTKSHSWDYRFDRFNGHHILLQHKRKFALTGGDAEVGAHITQSTTWDVYAGVGPYYFSSEHASSWGGKTRFIARYKEYVSLEASYSYDTLFKNVVQGTVALNYPFGKKLKRSGRHCPLQKDLMLSRAALSPYRFEIPVVKKKKLRSAAINPATQEPWEVWFVDNTSSSKGTFESPFPTLIEAQAASAPYDMIYVFPGDGTTNGMDMGIQLQNGQTLFGSGVSHEISTTKGGMTIPAFSTTAPLLTSASNVVSLANGNTVSGLNVLVTGAGAWGIGGSSVVQAVIDRNQTSGSVSYNGIFITGSGNISVTNNQCSESPQIGAPVEAGVQIQAIGDVNLNITNNTTTGFYYGVFLPSTTSISVAANISQNTFSNFRETGIHVSGQISPNTNIKAAKNTISNSAGFGIVLYPASGNYYVANNTIDSSSSTRFNEGIQIVGGNSGQTALVLINNNNVIVGPVNTSYGIAILNVDGTICTSITNNQVSVPTAGNFGVTISPSSPGVVNVFELSNNQAPEFISNGTGTVNLVTSCSP